MCIRDSLYSGCVFPSQCSFPYLVPGPSLGNPFRRISVPLPPQRFSLRTPYHTAPLTKFLYQLIALPLHHFHILHIPTITTVSLLLLNSTLLLLPQSYFVQRPSKLNLDWFKCPNEIIITQILTFTTFHITLSIENSKLSQINSITYLKHYKFIIDTFNYWKSANYL